MFHCVPVGRDEGKFNEINMLCASLSACSNVPPFLWVWTRLCLPNLPEPLNIVKYFAIRLPLYILWNIGTNIVKVVKTPLKSTTCCVPVERNIAEHTEQSTFVLTSVNIIIISLLLSLKRSEQKIETKKKPTEVGSFDQWPDHLLTTVNTFCKACFVATRSKSASVAFSHFFTRSAIAS